MPPFGGPVNDGRALRKGSAVDRKLRIRRRGTILLPPGLSRVNAIKTAALDSLGGFPIQKAAIMLVGGLAHNSKVWLIRADTRVH